MRARAFRKSLFARVDAGIQPKAAARWSFLGYLDFLHDHRDIYGNVELPISAGANRNAKRIRSARNLSLRRAPKS